MAKSNVKQGDRRVQWSEEKLMWYKLTVKNIPSFKIHKKELKDRLVKWDNPNNKDTIATKLYKLLTLKRYSKIEYKQTLIKYLPSLIRDGSGDQEAIQASIERVFQDLVSFMQELGEESEINRLQEKWGELEWRDFALEAKIEGSKDLRLLRGLITRHSPRKQMSLFAEEEEE